MLKAAGGPSKHQQWISHGSKQRLVRDKRLTTMVFTMVSQFLMADEPFKKCLIHSLFYWLINLNPIGAGTLCPPHSSYIQKPSIIKVKGITLVSPYNSLSVNNFFGKNFQDFNFFENKFSTFALFGGENENIYTYLEKNGKISTWNSILGPKMACTYHQIDICWKLGFSGEKLKKIDILAV